MYKKGLWTSDLEFCRAPCVEVGYHLIRPKTRIGSDGG